LLLWFDSFSGKCETLVFGLKCAEAWLFGIALVVVMEPFENISELL
jgi:hypothetical protein